MRGEIEIRKGRREDAGFLAPLVNRAGEGLPFVVWQALAEAGQDAWDVGLARIQNDDAGISYRNAWVAEIGGEPAGCVIAYSQPDVPEPVDDTTPAMFRPLLDLESAAPGTGYVYILSTRDDFRGRGVGTALLTHAERYRGPNGMSIIVSDGNPGAMRLYQRCGYVITERRAMIKDGWTNPGQNWVLMTKP